jgi:anthranilate synthase component 1
MEARCDMGGNRDTFSLTGQSDCVVHGVEQRLDLLDLHRLDPTRYPHLLQSAAHGRFDILFAFPEESLTLDGRGILSGPGLVEPESGDFLRSLDRWCLELQTTSSAQNCLPFSGGWFVYLGYELAGQIEPCLQLPETRGTLPNAVATRFASAVIYDHAGDKTFIVSEAACADRIDDIARDIAALPRPDAAAGPGVLNGAITESPADDYLDAVRRIHDYIREGDVFQVNLSRSWDVAAHAGVDVPDLYASLRQHNPAPFAGLARWDNSAIISSSPERLVRVHGRRVETRPIAGTRPRSRSRQADAAFSEELMAHPKERAEHIMLIDLERNDLGRISVPGSVQVDEFMVLESYAHVHHIVSNVRGELCADVSPGQVIAAVFPGGTITGCPKVRCMEIIAELEGESREAYTGSMGYINRDGSMDLNILIRSMLVTGDRIRLRAGAGIVADSVPEAELEETRAKARGLLRALGVSTA